MCHPEIVKYITEQAAGAGDVVAKKMFGDYALYCNGKVVGMICDDELYLKPIPQTASLFREIRMQVPYEGAKPHYVLTDTDDRDYVALLVRTTADNLPSARSKRN